MYLQTSSRCSGQMLLALTLLIPVLAFAPIASAAESAGEAEGAGTAILADPDPAQILNERAEAYYEARLKNSMELFQYYRPQEKGGPVSWNQVTEGRSQIMPESYEIERVEVDGEHGVVYARMKFAFTAAMPIAMPQRLASRVVAEK